MPDALDANKPLLLLGGTGMLGRSFRQLLDARGMSYEAPGRDTIDLMDEASIRAGVTPEYAGVINCAAFTQVDEAERRPETAEEINARAVREIAYRCVRFRRPLLHFSTDYVFDGTASKPYSVDARPNPISEYGRSKRKGERAADREAKSMNVFGRGQILIVRTSWVYAPWGQNFVRRLAHKARTESTLPVVHDQTNRPTSAEHLAAASLELLSRGHSGIWHVCDGGEPATRYDMARHIVGTLAATAKLEACPSSAYPRLAERPAYSVLDLSKTEADLGPMPDWRENLADVLRRLEPQEAE